MKNKVIIFIFSSLLFSSPTFSQSTTQQNITLIINQVRGQECCAKGSFSSTVRQLRATQKENLSATFALRFDALKDSSITNLFLTNTNSRIEIAGLLEITPELARSSGVEYIGTEENWYSAQHVFLIGYAPDDRKKLIDTFMDSFHQVFNFYPTTTVSWMIDPVSLQYLHEKYSVTAHEITREQWGTDSYTLHGAPPHYPYHPSENWAAIPAQNPDDSSLPLILRQTISDPVWGYGDSSSSHTSQPNDYLARNVDINYFKKLFFNAHHQPTEIETFALVGLENSMEEKFQVEFEKQISVIGEWQKTSPSHLVLTAQDYAKRKTERQELTVYGGRDQEKNQSGWWITTSKYRVRLRQDNQRLYISDLRIYDQNFVDPYLDEPAGDTGYWVVPFLVDGSRYYEGDNLENSINKNSVVSTTDNFSDRKEFLLPPTRLELSTALKENLELVRVGDCVQTDVAPSLQIQFCSDNFVLPNSTQLKQKNFYLDEVIIDTNEKLFWQTQDKKDFIGLNKEVGNSLKLTPFAHPEFYREQSAKNYFLLFPEIVAEPLDAQKSKVVLNNQFAVAGRNPVRLVFYPKNSLGIPVLLESPPMVETTPTTLVSVEKQHSGNGLVFIDLKSDQPQRVLLRLKSMDLTFEKTVYFAPDCKVQFKLCVRHPKYLWWYIRNLVSDKIREWRNPEIEHGTI